MNDTAGAVYVAGLLFSESLRFRHRVARHRPGSQWVGATRPSRAAEAVVLGGVLVGIWLLPLASVFTTSLQAFAFDLPPWAAVTGVCLFLASLTVRWIAQGTLAGQWSHTLETADRQALVTHGIYSRVRHPIYASLVLWACAQPLLLQNALSGFSGALAVALLWLVRVPREEAMLLARFGEDYRAHMSRTGRLLPRRR
jgi:protein-S-isoprenylcysteine O-methyltransferase Ste14